jgi:membrane protein required for colicin V production
MDTLIYIVLAVGAVIGLWQGAFKQIANFLGVIAGLILAVTMYEKFGNYLSEKIGSEDGYVYVIAFVLIVIIVPVALGILATLLTKLFSAISLGWINRIVGALIGMLCYGLLMSVAFNLTDFVVSSAGMDPGSLEQRSPLFYKVKQSSQFIVPDIVIVTDSTEEAAGAEPRHGLADKMPPGMSL